MNYFPLTALPNAYYSSYTENNSNIEMCNEGHVTHVLFSLT